MATHPGIVAWETPWTEEPGRLQSIGSQRAGHDSATKEQEHNPSPVLRFDISSLKLTGILTLEQALIEMLERTTRKNKVEIHSQSMTWK